MAFESRSAKLFSIGNFLGGLMLMLFGTVFGVAFLCFVLILTLTGSISTNEADLPKPFGVIKLIPEGFSLVTQELAVVTGLRKTRSLDLRGKTL